MQRTRNFAARNRNVLLAASIAAAVVLLPAPAWSQCDTTANGTFKFLTQALPEGTTNAEYVARILSANADGPVTFSVDTLPAGLTLDPTSGFITGRPTSAGNTNSTFTADDTTQQVTLPVTLKISASGGGGNGGSTFNNTSLAEGRVGTAYSDTLSINNGVGPYIYGAANLPSGLSLNGQTGEIAGSPTSPGTFFTSLSVTDFGDDNKGVTVLPLTVLPLLSDFELLTQTLNNGEVGTPFCDTWLTQGETGVVTFSSTALPDGLALDPVTGEVSGAPTTPGTFD
ncbi:MAG: putative Ig domain-containing protein, partial [Planctomycetota bacterium]